MLGFKPKRTNLHEKYDYPLTVLAAGRPIASGTPSDIRNDSMVRDAYLGEEDMLA